MTTPTTIAIETLALRLATLGADNNTITRTRKNIANTAGTRHITHFPAKSHAAEAANRNFDDPIKATLAAIDHIITTAVNHADPEDLDRDGELVTNILNAYDNGINAAKENQ